MRPSMTARRPGTGLLYLITSGLLWGTGGLTGSLLSQVAGLSAMSVAACRLTAGGVLIVIFLSVTGHRWPVGRAAWTRIAAIGPQVAVHARRILLRGNASTAFRLHRYNRGR